MIRRPTLLLSWLLLCLSSSPESRGQSDGPPTWHALVIGVTEGGTDQLGSRSGAAADAGRIAELLIREHGLPERNVRKLIGPQATRGALLRSLRQWSGDASRVRAGDHLLLYVSGPVVAKDSRGEPGHFLVPHDGSTDAQGPAWGSLLRLTEVWQCVEKFPGRGVLVVLDGPPDRAEPGRGTVLHNPTDDQAYRRMILEGLDGIADRNVDGRLTVRELAAFLGDVGAIAPPLIEPPDPAWVLSGQASDDDPAQRLQMLRGEPAKQLQQVELLADERMLRELIAGAELLWPCHPEKVPAIEAWLQRCRDLESRFDQHRLAAAQVVREALLTQTVTGQINRDAFDPDWNHADRVLRWRHETLRELVNAHGNLSRLRKDLDRRLEVASTLWQRSIGDAQSAWSEAIEAIASAEAYGGLRITPQIGLVPLGPDPATGMWEFWEVTTGERPVRDPATGQFRIEAATGMVFVLLPGGPCLIGAQAADPESVRHDPQASSDEVLTRHDLEPFLIAKYEMTQAQWERSDGTRPSYYAEHNLADDTHPVESVSWDDGVRVLTRLGMQYPTEAQWEYAARGNTDTPWWCGREASSIGERRAGNLLDATARRHPATRTWGVHESWDDGYMVHAPVGTFAANPFGLHDVIGNVWEWCDDVYRAPEQNAMTREGARSRSCRGGGFYYTSAFGRSSARHHHATTYRSFNLGVRPVIPLR